MRSVRKIVIGSVLAVMGLVVVGQVMFSLEWRYATNRVRLYLNGVRSFHWENYSGLVKDTCDPHDPEARGCMCVALLHGLGDDASAFQKILVAPKAAWQKPVKLFALEVGRNRQFRDGDAPENYRVRNQASSIGQALAPVCPSWIVVGNSLGGWEAAWIALDHDVKVEKLVLLDAAGTRSGKDTRTLELFSKPMRETIDEFMGRLYYKPPKLSERTKARAADMLARSQLGKILQAQTEEDFLDGRVQSLRLPVMVLWGAKDGILPERVGKDLQSQIPGSIWREVPECAHLPAKECPLAVIQAINDMIRLGTM